MDTCCCLADVAKHELRVLMQETKVAIHGLERQRESVIQAIAAAQEANASPGECPDETGLLVIRLADSVHRLENVLNLVVREIERLEVNQPSVESSVLIPWPIPPDLLPDEHYSERDPAGMEHRLPQPVSLFGPPGLATRVNSQLR